MHEEVRRYEKERVANKSTYWLLFELIWRDFFRFSAIKWGNTMFHLKGPKRELPRERWTRDANRIRAWSEGQTGEAVHAQVRVFSLALIRDAPPSGYPFIDANMRELKLTGFMSNRCAPYPNVKASWPHKHPHSAPSRVCAAGARTSRRFSRRTSSSTGAVRCDGRGGSAQPPPYPRSPFSPSRRRVV